MLSLNASDPRAVALIAAIQTGDVDSLRAQLRDEPALAGATILDSQGAKRSTLHIAADWPGHFPNVAPIIETLVRAGADVNARFECSNPDSAGETPLHWAASSDDVACLLALLKGGANIEATGAVFTGGTPMSDAVVFAQWRAAACLLEHGATTTLWQAAALGLLDRVRELCPDRSAADRPQITNALWHAARGGQQPAAEYLLDLGADLNWVGYDRRTALDAALERGESPLTGSLRARGGRRAVELA
ncbi:MAG: ankyrin repeat domain-containing protein [Candidatus Eisenbacteria bacterium]|nr:ankyrin repeat domain-containing protein [Candidatus Eisenbacteria bacterium]